MKFVFVLICVCLVSVSCVRRQNSEIESQPQAVHDSNSEEKILNSATRRVKNAFEEHLPENLLLKAAEDFVSRRILKEYGAVFVSRGGAIVPPKIIFESEADCAAWQEQVPKEEANFGVNIELQKPAMEALLAARREANANGFNFTARGTWAGRRDFDDTLKIWLSRINPGLSYWLRRGKLTAADVERFRNLSHLEQIGEILKFEERGIYFSKDFSKSVLYSATPPGCSQHLSLLAIDINENNSAAVRAVLAKHGWFQTVLSDAPHFTFLGVSETELPALGLKKIVRDNRIYWVPAE